MEEICETKFCIQTVMPKNWQSENFNNNNGTDSICCKNVCHVMKPCQLPIKATEKLPDQNGVVVNTSKESLEDDTRKKALPIKSNETSVNNSTDNLSYLSDNGLIEEIILIPNISDEEVSVNSDDCVYAYRGADFDIAEQRNSHTDDETDFLEMDFDPDPTSEIDVTTEIHDLSFNIQRFNNDNSNERNTVELPVEKIICNENVNQASIVEDEIEIVLNGSKKETIENGSEIFDNNFRTRGARPKEFTEKIKKKTSKINNTIDSIFDTNLMQNNVWKEVDDTCLDCLEKEFLSKTVGKPIESLNCSKCHVESNCSFKSKHVDNFNNELNEFKNYDVFNNFLHKNHQRISDIVCNEVMSFQKLEKESTSFFSVDVDEKIIVQAFEKLDITFDKDVIRRYFDTVQSQRTFKDVPELIIYMSKKNCDYHKIIKLIKAASKQELSVTFKPNENMKNVSETVQVNACDILQAWTPQSDLVKLKNLGKRFSQANVLGKVVNLIRQAQTRNVTLMSDFILIPQYYKSGYISVTKIK